MRKKKRKKEADPTRLQRNVLEWAPHTSQRRRIEGGESRRLFGAFLLVGPAGRRVMLQPRREDATRAYVRAWEVGRGAVPGW